MREVNGVEVFEGFEEGELGLEGGEKEGAEGENGYSTLGRDK